MIVQERRRRVTTNELSADLRVAIARLSRRLRLEKADPRLSDGQMSALGVLHRFGPLTLTALAEHERVTTPSMNRTVNALVAAGYVERTGDPVDRRRVVLAVSALGLELVSETKRRRDAWLAPRLARLTPEQRAALAAAAPILRELADS